MLPLHCVQPIDGSFGFGFVPSPFSSDLCGRSLALQCEATSEQLVTSGRSSYSVLCVRQELGNHRQCTVFCLTVSLPVSLCPLSPLRCNLLWFSHRLDFPQISTDCAAAFSLFLLFFHIDFYAHPFQKVFLRAFLIQNFNLIQLGLKLDELFKILVQFAFFCYFNLVKRCVTK